MNLEWRTHQTISLGHSATERRYGLPSHLKHPIIDLPTSPSRPSSPDPSHPILLRLPLSPSLSLLFPPLHPLDDRLGILIYLPRSRHLVILFIALAKWLHIDVPIVVVRIIIRPIPIIQWLSATDAKQGRIRMIDDQIEFELIEEEKLHLGQFRIIRREWSWRVFRETSSGFAQYALDVHRAFFNLCSDVETGGEDQERVRLGKRILAVEPLKVDAGGGDRRLAERNLSCEFVDEGAEVDVEREDVVRREVILCVIRRGFNEALKGRKGQQPSIAKRERLKVSSSLLGRSPTLQTIYQCVEDQKSLIQKSEA
jgi:hypothetical protein